MPTLPHDARRIIRGQRLRLALELEPVTLRTADRNHCTTQSFANSMQSYPINCWLSVDANRRYFIKNGCPTNGSHAQIEQLMVNPGEIKFTQIRLPLNLFLNDIASLKSPREAKIECESMLCSGSSQHAFENVPTCPRTSACLKQSELPEGARRKPVVVSQRTLKILPARGGKGKSNPSSSNCSQQCAYEIANALLSGQTPPETPCPDSAAHRQHQPNVSKGALVVVALVSFFLGAAIMAAMWYINVKTDPQRKVCTVNTNRNLLFPPSYFDSTANCPPYDPQGKDGRPFAGSNSERQLLMR
ncbi:hypothetical protein L596_029849 [Steinernema carpocapsae]|uniref:ZP domain-containing protein n=1 Tax=Steinernema carpocapsae TaxID=34508 RepID=A0A4U5LR07_STECR|nr:hypothetical protein L596_029849 [Steinernema carpocapsae]